MRSHYRPAGYTYLHVFERLFLVCFADEESPRALGDMSVMPRTIEEALAQSDHEKRREMLEVALGAMQNIKVWQVASLPEDASAVSSRMLFGIKQPSGRYKCRFVAQESFQVHSEDCGETYACIAAMQMLRAVLPFSKLNKIIFGYFDPENNFFR